MRIGVTYDEVAAIADQIVAGGAEPTIRNVRDRLGRGSYSTIHRHLTAWRDARPPASSAIPQLPPSLLQEIERVLTKAVAEARAEIEARLVLSQAEAKDLSDAMGELEVEQERLQGYISNITTQRDALAVKNEAQASDIARLTCEVERERQATDLARTEVAHTRLKIEGQAEKISEQGADIARLTAERETEAKARIAAEQASAVKDARLEAMQQLLDAARHDVERLTGQVDLERQAGQRERARAEEQQKTAADAREALAGLKALAEKKKPGRPKTRQGGAALRRHEVAEHVNG
jgi:chromosome segregation ATPase